MTLVNNVDDAVDAYEYNIDNDDIDDGIMTSMTMTIMAAIKNALYCNKRSLKFVNLKINVIE